MDFTKPGELANELKSFSPDVVFHAGSYYPHRNATPADILREQLTAFFHQCHAIEQAKPKVVVFTSTIGTIPGRADQNVADEKSMFIQVPEVSAYHFIKVQFERVFMNVFRNHPWIRAVIVNPGMVIAPDDPKPGEFNFLLRLVARKIPAIVNKPMLVVSGTDVGSGHICAALRGKHLERYILASDQMSLEEFFQQAHQYLSYIRLPSKVPLWLAMIFGRLSEWWATITHKKFPAIPQVPLYQMKYAGEYDFSKAQTELNYTPTPFLPELHRALDWARDQGH